jgi:hypothetical protein
MSRLTQNMAKLMRVHMLRIISGSLKRFIIRNIKNASEVTRIYYDGPSLRVCKRSRSNIVNIPSASIHPFIRNSTGRANKPRNPTLCLLRTATTIESVLNIIEVEFNSK